MINKFFKKESDSFNILTTSDDKSRKFIEKTLNKACSCTIDRNNKIIQMTRGALSNNEVEKIIYGLMTKGGIWDYLKDETTAIINTIEPNKIICEDNKSSYVMSRAYPIVFSDGNNKPTYLAVSLNTGYAIDIKSIEKSAASENVDLDKELEALLADTKSFWALKLKGDNSDAIEKMRSNIEERNKNIDKVRNKFFNDFTYGTCIDKGVPSEFGYVTPTGENMKNLIYNTDKYLPFMVYLNSYSFKNNGDPNYRVEGYLRSLSPDSIKGITGETYVLYIYIFFKLNKGMFGYKYVRPDGRTF